MKALCFGSMNIDYVYSLDHIVGPGETIFSTGRETFAGGKGLNQSVAMAKAGLPVWHAGICGAGGELLVETLESSDVSLEDSFRLYKEGMELLNECSQKIDRVEKKMLQMNEDGTFREF